MDRRLRGFCLPPARARIKLDPMSRGRAVVVRAALGWAVGIAFLFGTAVVTDSVFAQTAENGEANAPEVFQRGIE